MNDPQKLIPVYALLSRIRLSSSQRVLESAEKVIREFGDVCRIELDSMQKLW